MSGREAFKRVLRTVGKIAFVRTPLVQAVRSCIRISPARAIRDLLVGPVTSYLLPPEYRVPVTMPDGTRLHGGPLDIVTRMILYFGDSRTGCWEPRTARIATAIAKRGGDIIVGGAHVGFYAIPLARAAARLGGRVFAFEPAPVMFEELRRNVALNDVPNLTVERQALASSSGAGTLYLQGVRSSLHQPAKGPMDRRERVRLVSIDDYVAQHGITMVSLLFLDIEGAELAALHGAEKLLRRHDAPDVLFEIISAADTGPSAAEYLSALGFTVYYIDDDYELVLREAHAPLCVHPLSAAPANHRYFNALATLRPERLVVFGVNTEGMAPAA